MEKSRGSTDPRFDVRVGLLLLAAVAAVYFRVFGFGFIGYDDPVYILNNHRLREGSLWANLRWVFWSLEPDNWFPVTRLTHLLDFKILGLSPRIYHTENLVLHWAASWVLYLFLNRATGMRVAAMLTSLIFAVHPVHVESAAWIAERKDVLCGFFWMLTLLAWTRYTEAPSRRRYLLALAAFCLGLMSKPTIVTLPAQLFLLDLWPLRRKWSMQLLKEKIPFAALAAVVATVTVVAQRIAGTVPDLLSLPLGLRLATAATSIPAYLRTAFWPIPLWAPYAYPDHIPAGQTVGALVLIVAFSALAVAQRHRPYLAVGWFWFVLTLMPTIGLVQAGPQARADRYMYMPLAGITIAVVWLGAELAQRLPGLRIPLGAAAAAAVVALMPVASAQTLYWRDAEVLFRHALAADSRNFMAWNYLALAIDKDPSRRFEVIAAFRNALQIRPDSAPVRGNLAGALHKAGRTEEGLAEYQAALRLDPRNAPIHFGLAGILALRGQTEEAIQHYRTAVQIAPSFAGAHSDLGMLLMSRPERQAEALHHLESAAKLNPADATILTNYGFALLASGKGEEAAAQFMQALRLDPGTGAAHRGLALVFEAAGMEPEASEHREAAARLGARP